MTIHICYVTSFGGQLTELLKTAMIILLIPLEAADKLSATNEEFELQIEYILHQNALEFLFYLLSVFVRITLTYYILKFLVRIWRYVIIYSFKFSAACNFAFGVFFLVLAYYLLFYI